MTPQQIKDAAPDGATHYYKDSYYKFNGKYWYFWNFTYWAITYRDILSFVKPL